MNKVNFKGYLSFEGLPDLRTTWIYKPLSHAALNEMHYV